MRGRVVDVPRKTETKGIGITLCHGFVQLLFQVGQNCGPVRFETRWISGQSKSSVEIKVCEAGNVVKVQGVCGIIRTSDVRIRPVCRLLQVEIGIDVRKAHWQATRPLQGEVQFHSSQLHCSTSARP